MRWLEEKSAQLDSSGGEVSRNDGANCGAIADPQLLARRPFLKGFGSAIALVTVAGAGAGARSLDPTGWVFAGEAAPAFVEYHNVTPVFHRRQTEELPAQGYRLVSLSVYDYRLRQSFFGFILQPRYAVVWLKQDGPAQQFVQDVDANGFQASFDALAGAGFKPVILTATTSSLQQHRFAAVFEKTSGPIPLTRHQLINGSVSDPGSVQYWMEQARTNRWRPVSLTAYGTAQRPLFAGVWEPNPAVIAWSADGLTETAQEYQKRFEAQAMAWNRPVHVTVSPTGRYLSLFQDDRIGPWIARHNLVKEDFERQRDQFAREGFFPLSVQAGGMGNSVRYAAIFTKQDRPVARRFTLKDCEDIPRNDVDEVMGQMIVANGIRQAALAVVHNQKLLFARGYTWAEPGYPLATATTYFRVGSCSKVLTALMIMHLAQEAGLHLDMKIQNILHLTSPTGLPPSDARFNEVTVGQALTFTSGLRRKWDDGLKVARAFNSHLPATKLQLARYAVGQPGLMERDPGKDEPDRLLSDFAYLLLSLVVEAWTGAPSETFAQVILNRIGRPLGATRIRSGKMLVAEQLPGEARYHDDKLWIAPSVTSDEQPLVPFQYGADNLPALAGAGGLSVAAADFARVLAALNLGDNNPVLNSRSVMNMLENYFGWDFHGYRTLDGRYHRLKGGYLEGLQSTVNFTQGEYSYVIYWAKDGLVGEWYPEFPALRAAIPKTLNPGQRDRFPDFGMPSF
jgi:CubicO group peptidase (beta-lactamase class C family)